MQSCLELIPRDTRRVFVAYSGGLDSQVLLHLLVSADNEYEIIPWHVNHGLIDIATSMEAFCVEQSRLYGLEMRIDRLDPALLAKNTEAQGRRLRYRLFEDHVNIGDCVVTAHHAKDQAETFLLNAFRGAGPTGLRGIARRRKLGKAWLLRPLLDCSRELLEAYAEENELSWFSDPSNADSRYDRNYLRNEILPMVEQRWPGYLKALVNACEIQAGTQQVLDDIAAEDYMKSCEPVMGEQDALRIDDLSELSPERCKNLLRYWIGKAGLATLPFKRLLELIAQIDAREDANPEISMPGYSIRIYDRKLFLVADKEQPDCQGDFDFGHQLLIEIDQLGLKLERRALFERVNIEDRGQPVLLKFRSDGAQNPDRHRLKRLFQKHRVPPWRRRVTAQVYLDGKLEGLLL